MKTVKAYIIAHSNGLYTVNLYRENILCDSKIGRLAEITQWLRNNYPQTAIHAGSPADSSKPSE